MAVSSQVRQPILSPRNLTIFLQDACNDRQCPCPCAERGGPSYMSRGLSTRGLDAPLMQLS